MQIDMLIPKIFTLSLRYMLYENAPHDSQVELQHALQKVFSDETFLTTMNAVDCQAAIHIDEELFPYVDIIAVLYASVEDNNELSNMIKDFVDEHAQQVTYNVNEQPASLIQRKIYC